VRHSNQQAIFHNQGGIMKELRNAFLTIIAMLVITGSVLAAAKTLTGTVTDTMCGKKHMVAGKSDADCTRECMKSTGNWTYGLVVGDKVYGLSGDDQKFDSLAGKKVTVTGQQSGTVIAVQSIVPAH
jgi:hypothetical protein